HRRQRPGARRAPRDRHPAEVQRPAPPGRDRARRGSLRAGAATGRALMALLAAVLVFAAVTIFVTGLWAIYDWRRRITARLGATARVDPTVDTGIAGEASGSAWVTWKAILRRTAVCARLAVMAEQAGYRDAGAEWLTMIVAAGLVGAVVASLRTGSMLMAAATALVFGTFPVGYLFYQRHQRLVRFEQQLPDALGMMTRALRAG